MRVSDRDLCGPTVHRKHTGPRGSLLLVVVVGVGDAPLAITIAELGAPILEHVRYRWLIQWCWSRPLVFELNPRCQFGWMPVGLIIVVVIVLLAWFARREAASHDITRSAPPDRRRNRGHLRGAAGLTVTPTQHKHERGTVVDTFPDYAYTLGGSSSQWGNDSTWVNLYADTTAMPSFVGDASYSGEQLLMWWNTAQLKAARAIGIYHAFLRLDPTDLGTLHAARQVLLRPATPGPDTPDEPHRPGVPGVARFPQAIRYGACPLRGPDVGIGLAALWLIDLHQYLLVPLLSG